MKLITCEFNMDSGCVELRFDDGTILDIDCTVIEHEYGHTLQQRTELDWLVYNRRLCVHCFSIMCERSISREKTR